jgi:hypothetical protein
MFVIVLVLVSSSRALFSPDLCNATECLNTTSLLTHFLRDTRTTTTTRTRTIMIELRPIPPSS